MLIADHLLCSGFSGTKGPVFWEFSCGQQGSTSPLDEERSFSSCDTRSVKRRARLLVLLFVVVIWQLHVCSAQDIVIRLIDARNGRVFASETVSLQFIVGKGVKSHQETLEAKTGVDGVARFRLPVSPPSKFGLSTNGFLLCSDVFEVDTQQVIQEGLAPSCSKPKQGVSCKCGRQVSQLPRTAGQVVLLVRPITGWDKLWWRLSGKSD